ncbi:hypothetical protein H072_4791 [Dactylellina haptotyla CBS 200.50]|uniref:Uncharacterized protein n=1 Tax=Dactylellina haptotyla (strain CBS 200.50) TaxID=1284197 RepID=S8C0W0_DACHA|nr:hypothetical protein H072_4791 [Dactylellina haptotyla CBS 200.50]
MSLPPPYKLVVWKNEDDNSNFEGVHASIFDHGENPMPTLKPDSLQRLLYCSPGSIKFIEDLITGINSSSEIEGSGYAYSLYAMGVPTKPKDDYRHCAHILKLINRNTPLNDSEVVSKPLEKENNDISQSSTSTFLPPYHLAIFPKNGTSQVPAYWTSFGVLEEPTLGFDTKSKTTDGKETPLLNICSWPAGYLKAIEQISQSINKPENVRGRYCVHGMSQYLEDTPCYIAWKLADGQTSMKIIEASADIEASAADGADSECNFESGMGTPTSFNLD